MRLKPTRTDRLTPEERQIVDRFERGLIDAAEAGRLLIESTRPARHEVATAADESAPATDPTAAALLDETPEEAEARELVERIARDVYGEPG